MAMTIRPGLNNIPEVRSLSNLESFLDIFDSLPFGIQITRPDGEPVYANRSLLDLWGCKNIDDLQKLPLAERLSPENGKSFYSSMKNYHDGITYRSQVTVICQNGEGRSFQVNSRNVVWNGEKCVQSIFQDLAAQKPTEASLRFLDHAFFSIRDGIFILNNDFIVTHWNNVCEKLFGIITADAVGKHISASMTMVETFPGQNAQRIRLLLEKGYNQEEQVYRTPIGDVWVDVHTQAIIIEGKRQGWVTLVNDITPRKTIEEALNFKNTLLEALAENTTDGILVTDENNKKIFCNGRFRELWGLPLEFAETCADNDMTVLMTAPVKDPEDFIEKTRQIIESKVKHSRDRINFSDGRILERYTNEMFDKQGRYCGRLWYYRDITEPVRMREGMEMAAREWRTTFDSITDRISIHDRENRLTKVNKAFAARYDLSPEEIISERCNHLVHEPGNIPANCPWQKTMQTGKPATVEVFSPDSGSWVQESASPIFDDQGQVTGTVNIIKDVTELRQMEQQLIMTDRLASIGELVSGIAHELNNPLTGVIGFAQLLLEKDVSDDVKEDLTIVAGEAQRAARIVRNLLAFARKHTPVKQPSRINSIIEDVLTLRAYEQKVNNIEVFTRLDDNLPEIMLDYFQIQQVFLNIVINAEYFMIEAHRRGTLTVISEKIPGYIRISISDDGPGIKPVNLKRIFDPFYTTKEVGKGTGLGLSICHGIVTEHGGNIYAKSEQGKGATFVVELPI